MMAGETPDLRKSAGKDPGVQDCGSLTLRVDQQRIDVQFLDLREVKGQLRQAFQANGGGRQVRRRLSPVGGKDLKAPELLDHLVGPVLGDGGDPEDHILENLHVGAP